MNRRARFVVVMSSTCLVALLLLGGAVSRGSAAENSSSANSVYKHLSVYSEVLQRIKTEYVEEPDMSSVTLGALNGMLESIDPYASYLNSAQYKEYLKNFDTWRGDLGMTLARRVGYITVVSVIPGSPADKSGLTTGDFIESIKGIATRDMPLAYARLLLKGDPNTTIDLSVLRRKPEPQKITFTRAVVAFPAVESKMLGSDVGYIKASSLTVGKVKEIASAAGALQKKGAKRLVIDLRYCAEGDAEEGIELANLFQPKGLLGYYLGQKVARKDFNADEKKAISTLPLGILTNRGTAGAAEVAVAALQGTKRAQIFGEHTYGNAAIRRPISMDDGSAIILSVAKYYTPDGKSIQDNGITPDEQVADSMAPVSSEPDEDGAEPDAPAGKKTTEDAILQKALGLPASAQPGAPSSVK